MNKKHRKHEYKIILRIKIKISIFSKVWNEPTFTLSYQKKFKRIIQTICTICIFLLTRPFLCPVVNIIQMFTFLFQWFQWDIKWMAAIIMLKTDKTIKLCYVIDHFCPYFRIYIRLATIHKNMYNVNFSSHCLNVRIYYYNKFVDYITLLYKDRK